MKNVFGQEIRQDPLEVSKEADVDNWIDDWVDCEKREDNNATAESAANRCETRIRAVVSTDINGKCNALCNICHGPLAKYGTFYDAATRQGRPWGWLCLECFQRFGKGIGTGMGQEYDSNTLIKLRG